MRCSFARTAAMFVVPLAAAIAVPAAAQEAIDPPSEITVTGGITALTDYRFRGTTQTDEDFALQGTVNVNHASGFYVGAFASNIDGDGTTPALTGYGDVEIDLYAGYTKTFESGVGMDVGLLYYWYADAVDGQNTDFFEPYAAVTYTLGPVSTKLGVAYAWGGQKGLDFTTSNDDNIYGYLDASAAIPSTPITVKGHLGYSSGPLGLLNPTADDDYWDWSLGAEAVKGPFKAGVSYIDTDISNGGGFAQRLGRGSTVVGYVGFVF